MMCNPTPTPVPQLGTLTLHPGDAVVFFGDSISTPAYEWYAPLQDDVDAYYAGLALPAVNWEVEAVGGNTMAQLLSRVADVTAHSPDAVMIAAGINDAALGVAPATTAAALEDILDAILLANPDAQIAVLGPWVNGVSLVANAKNPAIDATNDAIRDVAVAYDVAFIDWRRHYQSLYLLYTTDCATLAPDGVHPSAAGRAFLSDAAMGQITLANA
jgi:lysophospholipase L1-like esterase